MPNDALKNKLAGTTETVPVTPSSSVPALSVVNETTQIARQIDTTSPDVSRELALGQSINAMDFLWQLAGRVANTPMAHKDRGNPDAVFAKMMRGYEVGLQPMQSLDAVELIEGTPTLKPEVMLAIIRQHGHDYRWDEQSETRAVISAHRREWPADRWTTFTFTLEHARQRKLINKDNWQKQPEVMLGWRAVGKMGRAEFSDVLHGLSYVPDEILDIIETNVVEPTAPTLPPADVTPAEPTKFDIAKDQFNQLTPEQKTLLREWWAVCDLPKRDSWHACIEAAGDAIDNVLDAIELLSNGEIPEPPDKGSKAGESATASAPESAVETETIAAPDTEQPVKGAVVAPIPAEARTEPASEVEGADKSPAVLMFPDLQQKPRELAKQLLRHFSIDPPTRDRIIEKQFGLLVKWSDMDKAQLMELADAIALREQSESSEIDPVEQIAEAFGDVQVVDE